MRDPKGLTRPRANRPGNSSSSRSTTVTGRAAQAAPDQPQTPPQAKSTLTKRLELLEADMAKYKEVLPPEDLVILRSQLDSISRQLSAEADVADGGKLPPSVHKRISDRLDSFKVFLEEQIREVHEYVDLAEARSEARNDEQDRATLRAHAIIRGNIQVVDNKVESYHSEAVASSALLSRLHGYLAAILSSDVPPAKKREYIVISVLFGLIVAYLIHILSHSNSFAHNWFLDIFLGIGFGIVLFRLLCEHVVGKIQRHWLSAYHQESTDQDANAQSATAADSPTQEVIPTVPTAETAPDVNQGAASPSSS